MRSPNQSSQSPTTSSNLSNKNGRATKRKSQSIDTDTPPPHDSEEKGASNGASDQATKKRRKVNHGESHSTKLVSHFAYTCGFGSLRLLSTFGELQPEIP